MPTVFNSKDSVFFVGGAGTKAGDANAGGCTKAFWDASLNIYDVFGGNGGPKADVAALPITERADPDEKIRMTSLDADDFESCQVGQVAYLYNAAPYVTGRYEIIAIDTVPIMWIDLDLAWAADVNGDCKVGGAFDTLQNVVDNCDAGNGYNVHIYDNKPQTLAAGIDFDTTGGSIADNSQMIGEAFNTQPGDMNKGGAYYQSPLDCLINGVDTTKCVTLDADGGAYNVITINNFDGLVLKNFYFYNTDKAAGHNCIEFLNTPVNIGLINCRFDTAYQFMLGTLYSLYVEGAYIGADLGYARGSSSTAYGGLLFNSVFNGTGRTNCARITLAVFDKCLFWGSSSGLYGSYPGYATNCVFYGQTVECLSLAGASYGCIAGHNNIFMPAAAGDYVALAAGATGSVPDDLLKNSCIWTIAGVAVTNHISVNGITRQLSDVIEADPQFVDAANGDFRLKLSSPAFRTGISTLGKL